MKKSEKKNILFVINPVAGTGLHKGIEPLINKYLDSNRYNCEIFYTAKPKQALHLRQLGLLENLFMVVAVGGDGTVNEVASNIVKEDVTLGIIPTGSGNGFARHFNIPLNVVNAIKLLNTGKPITVDSGKIQGNLFLNVAGLGFDAYISSKFANLQRRGFLSYIKLAVNTFYKYRSKRYQIKIGDEVHERTAFLIAIANTSQYGNNAFIAPNAILDDGKFDICIMKPIKWYQIAPISIRLFAGTLHKSSMVEYMLASRVEIEQESNYFHYDGEPANGSTKLMAEVMPLSIKVMVN